MPMEGQDIKPVCVWSNHTCTNVHTCSPLRGGSGDDLRDRSGNGHVLGNVALERHGDHGRTPRLENLTVFWVLDEIVS